jgi:hypothetical protein
MVLYLTAATLDQGYHDKNHWLSTLLQHSWIKEMMIETLGSIPYCSIPRRRKLWKKPLVQYLTAASLDQGNHDGNPWFSILLHHPSIKEIMIETLGSVLYCSIPWSRKSWKKPLFQYLTAVSLDQGNHDRNPWFSTILHHPLIKEIMIETLGSVPYCSIPRSGKSW